MHGLLIALLAVGCLSSGISSYTYHKRSYYDQTIKELLNERVCWWNEVCKEEFQPQFRCRCPKWSYCRGPGKYYDAHCSITTTGYIWLQPDGKAR